MKNLVNGKKSQLIIREKLLIRNGMEMAYRCLKGKMKQGKIPAGIREETLDKNNTVCYTEHGSY